MLHVYETGLKWVLRNRLSTMIASLIILGATIWLFMIVPKGFIPNEDQDQAFINIEAAQGIGFPYLVRHQLAAMKIVSENRNVAGFFASAGSRRAHNPGIISIVPVP